MATNLVDLNPVIEETSQSITQLVSPVFNSHIDKATRLKQKYQTLNSEAKNMAQILRHKRMLNNSISLKKTVSMAYKDAKNETVLVPWLNKVKKWSLDSYKEIMSFREFITGGQVLQYDVMGAGKVSYRLEEKEFLKLLSGDLSIYYTTTWDKLKDNNLINLLKLQVQDPSKKKRLKTIQKVSLKDDALYSFLSENVDIESPRLYELYSQLKGSFEWHLTEKGMVKFPDNQRKNFFYSKERENKVINFVQEYLQTKSLVNDNIAFYRTGDAIQDNLTLIENKIGGSAVVSISTIKNAIYKISNLSRLKDAKSLAQRLKQIFTYIGKEKLAQEIQKGAGEYARGKIDEVVKQLNIEGYFS